MNKEYFAGYSASLGGYCYIEWKLENGNFSMMGSVYRSKSKSTMVIGGQIVDGIAKEFPNDSKLQEMSIIAKRWHLNDLHPGCEHQRADRWQERPIDYTKPCNAYGKFYPGQRHDSWNMLTWITPEEYPQGLLGKACTTCGYKFGSRWLREELPSNVTEKILSW